MAIKNFLPSKDIRVKTFYNPFLSLIEKSTKITFAAQVYATAGCFYKHH